MSDSRASQPCAIPEHVRSFLHGVSDSYEKLHTLLALFRCAKAASASELAHSLGLDETNVSNVLEVLHAAGVVTAEAQRTFAYLPDHGPRDASVEWLATHSEAASVEIAKLLNDTALSRLRVALRGRLSFIGAQGVLGDEAAGAHAQRVSSDTDEPGD